MTVRREPFHHTVADPVDGHAGLSRSYRERIEVVVHEQGQETPVFRERLGDRLRPFDQEAAIFFAERSFLEPDRRHDLGVLGGRQHGATRTGGVYAGPGRPCA